MMAMADKVEIKLSGRASPNAGSELPIDGLPESVRTYIEAVCDIYHCPREFVTVAALATAATAVGKKIRVNEGKYHNSLVLWFVSVARSGSNKSYPMKLVTAPLRKIDAELYAEYKKVHDDWKGQPAKERGDEPRCPAIVLDDRTDERRSEILFMNNETDSDGHNDSGASKRGVIGIYPELKGMFDAKNQYTNGGTAPISKLLRLFDCEDIKVDRRNGFTMLIKNPFCSIIGDLQTGMLRPTFGSELFMTNGLNQRFLFCIVEDIDYPKRSHKKLPFDIEQRWALTIRMLYDGIYHSPDGYHYTLFRNSDGMVTLSEGADRLYEDYYNILQEKKRKAPNDYIASIYSKLQIQVLRYAGIVHALEVAEERGQRNDYYTLHEGTMAYSIRCMDYFERMALLVYAKITDDPQPKPPKEVSNADIIRELFTRFPNISGNRLASLIGCSPAYISKVRNEK